MPATNYRIRIVKPDFQFEAEGDKSFVLQMIERFEGSPGTAAGKLRGKPAGGEKPFKARIAASDKSLSVGEFVRKLGIKKHTDIVLAFGYYLEKYSGAASFTPADINKCYYDAKMESSNTSQMIIQNIRHGRIMEAKRPKGESKGKKSYILTRTGEEFIESKLSKNED